MTPHAQAVAAALSRLEGTIRALHTEILITGDVDDRLREKVTQDHNAFLFACLGEVCTRPSKPEPSDMARLESIREWLDDRSDASDGIANWAMSLMREVDQAIARIEVARKSAKPEIVETYEAVLDAQAERAAIEEAGDPTRWESAQ